MCVVWKGRKEWQKFSIVSVSLLFIIIGGSTLTVTIFSWEIVGLGSPAQTHQSPSCCLKAWCHHCRWSVQSATNINYWQCDFKSCWKAFGFKVFTLNQRCLLLKVLRPHVKTVGTKTATWNELHILCSLIIHQTRELTKQFLQENNLNQFSNLSNNDINIQKLWWLKVRVVMVTRVSELAPREWRVHGTDSERQISWTLLFSI